MSKRKAKTSTAAPERATPEGGSYTVLARRYRSRDFSELVGQEPIARTLQNAIASNRTAHAYLFCGTRGVGKTSMARIFARALNVDESLEQKDEIAKAIFRGDDLDVIEIDGASNRGIADAKDLIAGAGLSPARCRYKIYIIDEVHMLTREAFNALLKTMEEPPSHVKFILCTTEANKVPATIQSRCQRFDFRPLTTATISEQLRRILDEEKIEAEDDVVTRVAQLGNGSMRDALSLLDRLLASGEGTLTLDLLEQMVGLPDQSFIEHLMDAIIAGDASEALSRGDELLRRGTTIEQSLELLLEHLRSLLVIAACGPDSELAEQAGEGRAERTAQASHFDAAGLVHLIALCDAVHRNARNSAAGRALFDAAIVRMCMSEHFASLPALLQGAPPPKPAAAAKKKAPPAHEQAGSIDATPPQQPQQTVAEVKPERTDSPSSAPLTGEAFWQQILDHPEHSHFARMKLQSLNFDAFDGKTLRLSINEQGSSSARLLRNSLDELALLVHSATGRHVKIEIVDDAEDASSHAAQDSSQAAEAEQLPLVREAMDIFDARVIDVSEQ